VMFGLLFGATMTAWVGSRLRALRSRSPSRREEVITAVRRGRAVADAGLASAVIAYAEVVRRAQLQPRAVRRLNMLLVAAGVIAVVGALPRHRPNELLIDGFILALLVRTAM